MDNQHAFCDAPDLEAVVGSHLYGVSKPESDLDLRGFVAEPEEYLIGMEGFEQKEYKDEDRVVYGMKKFFTIVRQGNTNAFEVLFANEYRHMTDIGRLVVENRHLFATKAYYRAIRGFALAEWRKARAVTLVMEHDDKQAEDLFTQLAGKYQLKRFEINEVLDTIFVNREGDPRREVSATRHLGERRKADVQEHGFSVKNAYHSIRLLHQGIELMESGTLTFPRPNADELRAIRNGAKTIEELDVRFKELDAQLQVAAEKSSLPTNADRKAINDLYLECVRMKLRQTA
jgi:hypothetical protein